MASCNEIFSIPYSGNADALIVNLKNEIIPTVRDGGVFDPISRSFTIVTAVGKVKGTYKIESTQILVSITDKPSDFFVNCNRIKNEMLTFMSTQPK